MRGEPIAACIGAFIAISFAGILVALMLKGSDSLGADVGGVHLATTPDGFSVTKMITKALAEAAFLVGFSLFWVPIWGAVAIALLQYGAVGMLEWVGTGPKICGAGLSA